MVSEALTQIMELMAQSRLPLDTPIAQVREMMAMAAAMFPPEEAVAIQETEGNPAGEWLIPDGAEPDRALLYLHGGGFVLGSPAIYRHVTTRLARAARLRTLAPDYRLAPEHPFPAGLDDAVAAYQHLLDTGIDPGRIAVAGDSAGGGLTVSLMLACKQQGLPLPAVALLFSPWLDLAGTGDSVRERASRDPLIRPEDLTRYASLYLDGKQPETPLASPLCGDLTGLPETTVYVGTEEVLFDDAERFVAAARQAGVRVHYAVGELMPHAWPFFAPVLPEALATLHEAGATLAAAVNRHTGA